MYEALVITPVKDSLATTLDTIKALAKSSAKIKHIVFNDFSTEETKTVLTTNSAKYGFELINLEDITTHPSPNYKLVLQKAQTRAQEENVPLIIVESDVCVKPDTIQKILAFSKDADKAGMVGAVTVDESGTVNFPYLKFKTNKVPYLKTERSLSFCCTLLTTDFLNAYSFLDLDASKDWFDVFISRQSVKMGFNNYILLNVPVLHQPHGSRPWKQLKYTNPLKYYFLKLINKRDKI
ncbi:family 2 glycosyl transferase [Pelobium manganitolerans]|uniref:Family 2 glycosyl transferase n=1 Tax=Pelobium manganitolerans TaxID=1842495 RepID=A0A419SAJ7_9SPHI|nr:glycosyltransferase [Pelobium manganitolerans]RKD19477.1 family 2 glycosyl transferase [Pelobium manganitolerans]